MPQKRDEDPKNIKPPEYSEDEKIFRNMLIKKMESARDQRDSSHVEFDGMTYKEYWQSNAKAGNSYIAPKINKHDVRITSGTTKEKKNTLLSTIINYNFQPDIEAYDKYDQHIAELGTVFEDLIKKSYTMEEPDWELKWELILNELLDQGDVFVEDTHVEFSIPTKTLDKFGTKFSEMEWEEGIDKIYKACSTELLCGLNVYLGNIREFFLEKQPYIFTQRMRPRAELEAKYGTWERWKNVPERIVKTMEDGSNTLAFNDWSLEPLEEGMGEEIKFYSKYDNDFMVMINGVMMFPVKRNKKGKLGTFPLSSLNGKCEYPIAKGSLEPISAFFAYSKSVPAKTKVDQTMFDEMLKAIILKTRKSYQPPMADNTGTNLSASVFYPGTIHRNVDADKIKEIGNNTGVTQSEFNTAEFIRGIINDKSVSSVFEGQQTKGGQTAREIVELKQQSMMKLGVAILGVINLRKRLAQLRLPNILKHWTDPIDEKVEEGKSELKKIYRNVTVDTEFEEGASGQRIVEFVGSGDEIPEDEQTDAEAELLSIKKGKKIKKTYLNAEALKTIDYTYYFEIVPTEKNTSALKLAQFEETIGKMMSIFAPAGKVPNIDYLGDRWAVMSGEDPNRVWQQQQQGMPQMAGAMSMPQSQLASQLAPQQMTKPSLNSMVQAV